eukprot:408417-Pelagomonas_calceolata.AAC.1
MLVHACSKQFEWGLGAHEMREEIQEHLDTAFLSFFGRARTRCHGADEPSYSPVVSVAVHSEHRRRTGHLRGSEEQRA